MKRIFQPTLNLGLASCVVLLFLAGSNDLFAYVASSTSYRLQSDSINVGGLLSTSTNYRAEDTTGEVASGVSNSTTYQVKAGYQQMQETYLAITSSGAISLSPAIPSTGGGVADGQSNWTVTTDNPAGYTLSIQSSSSPALVSGLNSFADYTPAGANPDFTYSVGASAAEFGYTVEGSDVFSSFLDNGVSCNVGSGQTADRCWTALTTSAQTVSLRNSENNPSGSTITLKFRAESGALNVQPGGNYTATATLMLMAL